MKQPFDSAHIFCGSGIWTGHSGNGLSAPPWCLEPQLGRLEDKLWFSGWILQRLVLTWAGMTQSRGVLTRASHPRYPGCLGFLTACSLRVVRLLMGWLRALRASGAAVPLMTYPPYSAQCRFPHHLLEQSQPTGIHRERTQRSSLSGKSVKVILQMSMWDGGHCCGHVWKIQSATDDVGP